jgi:hypothetical protein
MKIFKVGPEPVASFEWEEERKGKTAVAGVVEYESDAGDIVVKIITDDHFAGVGAEYAFIRHKFPEYKVSKQLLIEAEINGKRVRCDELVVSNGKDEKRAFFDISDFFDNWG